MSTITDKAVAKTAAAFKPPQLAKVVRGTAFAIIKTTIIVLAALATDGWLSIALWGIVVTLAFPWLFLGLLQSITVEREARRNALCQTCRAIATNETVLVSKLPGVVQAGQR